jgi:hypothetical protein
MAIKRPLLITPIRSQVSSATLRVWVDIKTVTPCPASFLKRLLRAHLQ